MSRQYLAKPDLVGNRLAEGADMEKQTEKQITCECGFIARAQSEKEVIEKIRAHMRSDHPELLEKVSDGDLRGWIEEV
jgi:predicted small metal-binding protein